MAMLAISTEQLDFLDNNYIELSDEYYEIENIHHMEIVKYSMKQDLLKGKLQYKTTREILKDWFNRNFFKEDLEVSCYDLFEIANINNVSIIDL